MKVRVGEIWYSAEDQPIAIMLTDEELELIKEMNRENSPNLRFSSGHLDPAELLEWAKR